MAEDREANTEEATPHKREKMRDEGQVIRSQDVISAAVVIASCQAIGTMFPLIGRQMAAFAQRSFRMIDAHEPLRAMRGLLETLAPVMVPLSAAGAAAMIAGVAQSRLFSLSLLMPKPERFNPMSNLSQLIPSKQSVLELSKQVLKLVAVGFIGYGVIADAMPRFATLSSEPPLSAAASVAQVAGTLAKQLCLAFAVAAAVDYWLARRKFLEDAKMSKEEVREEHKQQEGRPEVRQRMRRRAQDMIKRRAMADIGKATVVVVNPTHYAVALRYLPNKDFAPIVIAKGLDELALQMRTRARKHMVPVVENKPLARSLYADAKVGRPIPVELYRAVAEVIAYVMQLKARDAGQSRRPQPPLPPRGES